MSYKSSVDTIDKGKKSNFTLVAKIFEALAKELENRPRVCIRKNQTEPFGVQEFPNLVHAGTTYNIEIEDAHGNVWTFESAVCLRTPNEECQCSIDVMADGSTIITPYAKNKGEKRNESYQK